MRFRQAIIQYAEKHGVTKAAIRYHTNRQYIYRWRKRYDGTLESLADRSHRPQVCLQKIYIALWQNN
ncbi:MAG: helix-turn-helix domain-containing protein [Acutalibacteraceae bacterium]|nr:helix-turn-helix domain-containing protein [Acutalibacteraceae bacterium]